MLKKYIHLFPAIFILFTAVVSLNAQTSSRVLIPARVKEKNNWIYGYKDSLTNELVIPYKYARTYPFYKGMAIVKTENSEYSVINTKGKIVSPYKSYNFELSKDPDLFIARDPKTQKTGVFDFSFRQVIPFQFYTIARYGEIFVVSTNDKSQRLYGIYNKSLESIFPVELESEPKEEPAGYIVNTIKGKFGLLKTSGEIVLPFKYLGINVFKDIERIRVLDTLRRHRILYLDGKEISDEYFDASFSHEHGFFPVQKNGKWGFFKDGLKIPCLYDAGYGTEYANGCFILKKGSKYGVTDSIGREIIPYTFDKVSWHNKNMFLTVTDNKYGLINSLGTVVVPCIMKNTPPQPQNGYFIFFDNNKKYGCIKEDGTPVVPFVLDEDYVKSNYKTAAPYLAKILTIIPDDKLMTYLDALGYYSSAKPKDALDYVTRIITKFIDKKISIPEQLYYIRAMAYTDLNDYAAANDDASRGGFTEWGKRAYQYMADKKLQQEDFQGANDFYVRAYVPLTDERRIRVNDELKKRNPNKPTVQNVIHLTPDAAIPTTILGFTKSDRKEASGSDKYKMLYTYSEAVAGMPQGYRLPTADDWVKLFEYIKKDQYDRYGRQGADGAYYVGNGWSKTYYTEGVVNNKATTYYSQNGYDLNISPLRSHKDIIGLTGDERVNYIDYWLEPAYYKGKKVNRISFDDDGYEFQFVDGGTACVRYVKK